ncbi:ADP-ribosylation factor-like protein 13B [Anguilla anguilla]|uniref:ADP-ribosylation factor-like protein 13B n=1 Tax=Anguilla anguilla TaxID=7936 RepID=UPI0015A8D75C|nr:ADP-ribosylation factor-like protein 13B [Anguilla anguilla]
MDTDFLLYELRRRWWPLCSPQLNVFNLTSSFSSWISQCQQPIRQVTILIVGLDNAGKTSTVRAILKVPLEEEGTPKGCVPTELRVDNFLVTVLEVGGASAACEAHGIVFVVDSCDRTRAEEAKDLLTDLLKQPSAAGKPLLVLANKQDKMNAMLGSELIEILSLEKLISQSQSLCHVEPCSALLDMRRLSDRKTLQGLRWLLRAVRLDYHKLCARVAQDLNHEEGKREKHKKAERGQSKHKEVKKVNTGKTRLRCKLKPQENEKKTTKKKTGDKLQPIGNILNKESTINRKLKKQQQVKMKNKVKRRPGCKEEEGERGMEVEQKGERHRIALLPGDCKRPKHKAKRVKETFPESSENSKAKKGKKEMEKKKMTNVTNKTR